MRKVTNASAVKILTSSLPESYEIKRGQKVKGNPLNQARLCAPNGAELEGYVYIVPTDRIGAFYPYSKQEDVNAMLAGIAEVKGQGLAPCAAYEKAAAMATESPPQVDETSEGGAKQLKDAQSPAPVNRIRTRQQERREKLERALELTEANNPAAKSFFQYVDGGGRGRLEKYSDDPQKQERL